MTETFTPNLVDAVASIQGQLAGLRALLEDEALINRVDGITKALAEITPKAPETGVPEVVDGD